MPSTDEDFMRRAIALAARGESTPQGGPIGCVIVQDGRIIGEGHNEVEGRNDPTAHAEVVAMRRAGETLQKSRFVGATLYSTLQPCGMCSMACIWAGISRIVYGAGREQVHSMYFEDRNLNTMDFIRDAYKDDLELQGGLLGKDCVGLYYGPHDDPPAEEQTNT